MRVEELIRNVRIARGERWTFWKYNCGDRRLQLRNLLLRKYIAGVFKYFAANFRRKKNEWKLKITNLKNQEHFSKNARPGSIVIYYMVAKRGVQQKKKREEYRRLKCGAIEG